jgi:hypothetical protein
VKTISQGAVPVVALALSDNALVGRIVFGFVELSLQEKEKTIQSMSIVNLKDCILLSMMMIIIVCAP